MRAGRGGGGAIRGTATCTAGHVRAALFLGDFAYGELLVESATTYRVAQVVDDPVFDEVRHRVGGAEAYLIQRVYARTIDADASGQPFRLSPGPCPACGEVTAEWAWSRDAETVSVEPATFRDWHATPPEVRDSLLSRWIVEEQASMARERRARSTGRRPPGNRPDGPSPGYLPAQSG